MESIEKIIGYAIEGILLPASVYGVYVLFKDEIKAGYLKLFKKEKKNGD